MLMKNHEIRFGQCQMFRWDHDIRPVFTVDRIRYLQNRLLLYQRDEFGPYYQRRFGENTGIYRTNWRPVWAKFTVTVLVKYSNSGHLTAQYFDIFCILLGLYFLNMVYIMHVHIIK